jgi:hypothetical protein
MPRADRSRLIACDQRGVTFKWKDYRLEGPERYQVMTVATHEFIRRFSSTCCPQASTASSANHESISLAIKVQ